MEDQHRDALAQLTLLQVSFDTTWVSFAGCLLTLIRSLLLTWLQHEVAVRQKEAAELQDARTRLVLFRH